MKHVGQIKRYLSRWYYLALLFSIVSFLQGCSTPESKDVFESGLIYCSESNPVTFNPQLDTSITTADATSHQIYDRLLAFDATSGRVIPSVATEWELSDEGRVIKFTLRDDVKFHQTRYFTPTRNLNADDVLFSIGRWSDERHPYHHVAENGYPYFSSLGAAKNIKRLEKLDQYAFQIHLHQPDSAFIANLATDFAVILSQEYADQLLEANTPELIDTLPIGSGPFVFAGYRKDNYIRYHRHTDYWHENSDIETLVFDITPRSSLRIAKLIAGECDVSAFPTQTDLEIIRQQSDLMLEEMPGLNIGYWAFNTRKPPFDNPDVRRALAIAIDKNTILEAIYLDSATRAKTLIPMANWAHQENAEDTAYNPIMAKKLLENAGLGDGFNMTVWAMPIERAYNPNAQKMAELIQRYLADIGVTVTIVSHEWNAFRRFLSEGMHDSVLIGWSADSGDPDNFYRPLLSCDAIQSGTNRALWCDERYDSLINQARLISDIEQRKQIYHQINHLLYEQIPLVPIAHAFRYQAYRESVQDLSINPYGGIRFAGVSKQL